MNSLSIDKALPSARLTLLWRRPAGNRRSDPNAARNAAEQPLRRCTPRDGCDPRSHRRRDRNPIVLERRRLHRVETTTRLTRDAHPQLARANPDSIASSGARRFRSARRRARNCSKIQALKPIMASAAATWPRRLDAEFKPGGKLVWTHVARRVAYGRIVGHQRPWHSVPGGRLSVCPRYPIRDKTALFGMGQSSSPATSRIRASLATVGHRTLIRLPGATRADRRRSAGWA